MLYFIHYSYIPNTASTNRLLAYLCNMPDDMKVRVFFIMPDKKNSRWENVPKNIDVIYCWDKYKCPFKLLKYVAFYRSLFYIKKQLHEGDIVYCYNTPLYMNTFRKKGVRLFGERTEHPEVTQPESRLIKFDIDKHLSLCKKLDGLFVISTTLKEYYISQGVEGNKIYIINMIVDASRFAGLEKETCNNQYIAYCGNASNNKDGVDKLIGSFSIVNKTHPDVLLYIIGKAPTSDVENNNIQLAHKLGVLDKIVFTGIVTADKMPQLLKNASVLVLHRPDSLQAQCGFPTKLGEYLLTENPVVITSVGDIPKFLLDKVSALIASPNNNVEFANKIQWALDNPIKADSIGKKGAETAAQFFNAITETRKLIECMRYEKNH